MTGLWRESFQGSDITCVEGLHASVIGRNARRFVILGRSKERSDAAQTLGSMP